MDRLEPTDDELLAELALGRRDALTALLARYERRIYGMALSILGDANLAQDACQEALERICRHAGAFDPARGRAGSWIVAIARNAAIDLRRRLGPRGCLFLSADQLSAPSAEPEPLESAISRELAERVRGALAELPAAQRRAIVLATYGGATAREVAAREGIPLGTAKTRLRSAMMRLRELLADERDPAAADRQRPAVPTQSLAAARRERQR